MHLDSRLLVLILGCCFFLFSCSESTSETESKVQSVSITNKSSERIYIDGVEWGELEPVTMVVAKGLSKAMFFEIKPSKDEMFLYYTVNNNVMDIKDSMKAGFGAVSAGGAVESLDFVFTEKKKWEVRVKSNTGETKVYPQH